MPQSIFLSYVYEDKPYRDKVERWCTAGKLGANRVTIYEGADVRHLGEDAIKQHLEPKIRGAAVVVGLVGQNTHNHGWVKYELDLANSLHKKILLMRVPGTTGSAPPGFSRLPIHTFDPSKLESEL